jgi:hypothetical protein
MGLYQEEGPERPRHDRNLLRQASTSEDWSTSENGFGLSGPHLTYTPIFQGSSPQTQARSCRRIQGAERCSAHCHRKGQRPVSRCRRGVEPRMAGSGRSVSALLRREPLSRRQRHVQPRCERHLAPWSVHPDGSPRDWGPTWCRQAGRSDCLDTPGRPHPAQWSTFGRDDQHGPASAGERHVLRRCRREGRPCRVRHPTRGPVGLRPRRADTRSPRKLIPPATGPSRTIGFEAPTLWAEEVGHGPSGWPVGRSLLVRFDALSLIARGHRRTPRHIDVGEGSARS